MDQVFAARAVRKIAIVGNHLPRRCGIATFTTDLGDAIAAGKPEVDCLVIAVNDAKRYAYPPRVRFEIEESDVSSYRRAADFINVNGADVLCVQHEYGIFGGKGGSHVLALLREVHVPIVTTLHTILPEPNAQQRAAMDEIVRLSQRIVVMTARGAELLARVHGVDPAKIDVIPHGTLSIPCADASKEHLGVEGKQVLLTFGLLSPDKGIEYVIDALPAILARRPETVYVVLGATHPHVREHDGETYRLMLESRARRLGVDPAVIFCDRFVSREELGEFLGAADIYITPYLNPEQSTSGTLAYAVGAGKAVISTPYAHARELLADGRGVLVPSRDAAAIAREATILLEDDAKRMLIRDRAAAHTAGMQWPSVAGSYVATFDCARVEHASRLRTISRAKTLAERPVDLPELELAHLDIMTDSTGILQHARFSVPRFDDGYCLDDNARALLLMALVEDAGAADSRAVRRLSSRYLAFVSHAYNRALGRFKNFMSYSRRWLEECGSEDGHGRALWALGTMIGRSGDPGRQSLGAELFHAALPAVAAFTSPRAWAFTLIGLDEYLSAFEGDSEVGGKRTALAERLYSLFQRNASRDWPWFEQSVTYSNARLSQALIASGARMRREEMTAAGLRSLDWLLSIQRSEHGDFAPIGSNGFYQRGGAKADFDQQPVEASGVVSACLEALRVTGDARWNDHAKRTFDWFLGQNHLQASLYDARTGGCRDALHRDRMNANEGAESTLSFLLALMEMRQTDRAVTSRAASRKAGA